MFTHLTMHMHEPKVRTNFRSVHELPSAILLVFSVTPFKIDQNKNQNRSIDKVQNLGNERRYICEDPRHDSGQQNVSYIRDIRRNVLPKYIEICMETPCWCPAGLASTWRTETSRNICYRVLLQKREFILLGTHKL